MKPAGQVDILAGTASSLAGASANFSLGVGVGPSSPGRKAAVRVRTSSAPSKIPQRPTGVVGPSAQAAAPDGRQTAWPNPAPATNAQEGGPVTAAAHVPERPQSTGSMSFDATSGASAANVTGFAAVPPPARTAASGTAAQPQPPMPVPTFAVGAADPQPGGLRTPRGGRMRANRQKTNATSPLLFAAPGAATGSSAAQLFSPGLGLGGLEAMTPMDENTYQKLVSKPASMGVLDAESPMDITPQGSTVSAASNVFVFSPLVGASFGGQAAGSGAAGASAGGTGMASSASSAPTPFQGFAAAVAAAAQASGPSTSAAEGVPAPGAGAPAPSGSGAASRTSSIGGGSASGSGLRFSIQLPIPGAREVHDMFTSAASSSGAPAAGNGSKGGAPPAAPGAVGSSAQGAQASKMNAAVSSAAAKKLPDSDSQGAKMAAAVAAAAAKKLPETDGPGPSAAGAAAKAGSAGGASSGAANQTGNDCQPPKDNAAKAARISVDSGGSASAAASRSGMPAVPAVTTFATAAETSSSALPVQQAAAAVSASAVASTAAALGMAAANAAASSASAEAATSPPDFLAAVAEQLENMARRTREAAAAAAAAQASAGSSNAAVVVEAAVASLASESNPAIRSVIEIMLRPGAIEAKVAAAAAATRASASDAAPGLAAAVACMLGALKLDESRATGTEVAAARAAAVGAADRSKSSDGSRGSSAGGIPSVPFVFGGASSGGSVTAGSSQGGTAAAPAPAAPSVAPATGSAAAAAFGAAPAVPIAAPVAAARQAPPQQQPSAVPYVFGAPNFTSHAGPQATTTAAAPAAAPAAPAGFGSSASFGRAHSVPGAPQAERPSSTGSATSLPFMFSANVTPQAQQPAAGQHASSMPQTAASFASAGASPMSTTPMSASQQSMQQQQPTAPASSSGWPAGAPVVAAAAAPPGGKAFQFTVGDAAAGGGATPARVGGRARTKITPRKTRGPVPMDTGAASRSSAGGVGDSTAATAAMAPAPPPAGPATGLFADRPSGSSAPAGGAAAQQQQQRASQPQGSSGDADAGLDTAALQAVRLKRTADEKKQYGNQKYELSDFKSAERWYSEAIDLLEQQMPQLSLNRDRLQQLFPNLKTEVAVLYSNRSGARLMTSKPHSALADALRAMELDPKFMRAASRAATCHCRLGDFAAAHRIIDVAMDRCSAASGHYQDMLKKLNEVVDLGSRARAATAAAVSAVSSGSREKLQEAADQLAAIRDPVGYCDVVAAARAVLALRLGFPREVLTLVAPHPEVPVQQRAAPWRLWLTVQAHYFKGDLQEALVTCKELQLAQEAAGRQVSEGGSASASGQEQDGQAAAGVAAYTTSAHVTVPPAAVLGELGESLQQLLKLKEDGNAAIKANKHAEAAESYSRALGLGCCPAYAAVLHANRAAAHAGQGALADAVADCGRAKALDPSYYKANSRLAAYMIELRRPEEATGLLEPLVKLASQSSGAGPRPEELTLIKERLSEARAAATWQKTPQHYKLLCLTNSCSEDDVKKAYRRLALKHHPDKALAAVKVSLTLPGRAGGAPYSGPLACSNEIETRVREEATALFNYINQAHEELTDKSRRRKVDQLLEAEQPPHSGRYGSSSSQYGGGWHNGGGSRYSGFSSFYGMDPFFFHRPGGAGPAGGGGGAGGAGGSSRTRSATGGGAGGGGSGYGGYGGYGSYGGARPTSARQTSAASGANGGGAARSSGNNAGASRNASGAGGGGGGAGGGYGGYGRAGGGGGAAAGARPAAGPGRKWWEGGNDYSDDDDEDTFNF